MPIPKRPKDSLYNQPLAEIVDFDFDASVTHVFADMINRSVPGYANIIAMIGMMAGRYAQAHTNLYDLGCSLGASSLAMQHQVKQPGCKIIAVDNSAAMILQLNERLAGLPELNNIETKELDIRQQPIENASVVVLNFTLQFLSPEDRAALLGNIYRGLAPGGLLILSEKLRFDDAAEEQLLQDLHYEFKRVNGYSELEIAQKRQALENRLIPDTAQKHLRRLAEVGFPKPCQWFQCFNFVSFLAIK